MVTMTTADVSIDVADEAAATALIAKERTGTLTLDDGTVLHCAGAAVERDHPVSVDHFKRDAAGNVVDATGKPLKLDATGNVHPDEKDKDGQPRKAVMNYLRDDKGEIVMSEKLPSGMPGKPMFPPPTPGKIRVRLHYE